MLPTSNPPKYTRLFIFVRYFIVLSRQNVLLLLLFAIFHSGHEWIFIEKICGVDIYEHEVNEDFSFYSRWQEYDF
jgi:hypothetical protein